MRKRLSEKYIKKIEAFPYKGKPHVHGGEHTPKIGVKTKRAVWILSKRINRRNGISAGGESINRIAPRKQAVNWPCVQPGQISVVSYNT
jgi:hypothetical protein